MHPHFCPLDDGYVLLHVPAEYLGGGVRCGQTRHPHPQRQSARLDPPRGSLWAVPHHIWGFSPKYWMWVKMKKVLYRFVQLKKNLNNHFRVHLSLWKLSLPATDSGFDLNSCSMNGTDPLKPKCPVLNESQTPAFPEWLTIIMLCVYLLFANILLLNLLIAIFKWVFLLHTFVSEGSPDLSPLFVSLCSSCIALRSRKFRTTLTESGNFKDMSWLRSTTAAPLRLLLSSSSAIFTSSSGTWCCAGPPSYAKSSVSIQLHGHMQHKS